MRRSQRVASVRPLVEMKFRELPGQQWTNGEKTMRHGMHAMYSWVEGLNAISVFNAILVIKFAREGTKVATGEEKSKCGVV